MLTEMILLDIATGWKTAIMVVLLIVVFYLFLIKPQSDKAKKEAAEEVLEEAETFEEMHRHLAAMVRGISETEMVQDPGSGRQTAVQAADFIRNHYSDPSLSIGKIADAVSLAPTYLSSLYKKQTGITIGQYLLEVRIARAKELMKDPQKKFYEIAFAVGYEDVDYFTRVFKRAEGKTPSEFRKMLEF